MFARILAFLLLGLIVYGTTVEAAHRHGKLVANAPADRTASLSDSGAETQADASRIGCSDCLICQLHQHFSASLMTSRAADHYVQFDFRHSNLARINFTTQTSAPLTGRAPPFSL